MVRGLDTPGYGAKKRFRTPGPPLRAPVWAGGGPSIPRGQPRTGLDQDSGVPAADWPVPARAETVLLHTLYTREEVGAVARASWCAIWARAPVWSAFPVRNPRLEWPNPL